MAIKKVIVSLVFIGISGLYVFSRSSDAAVIPTPPASPKATQGTATPTPISITPVPTPTPPPPPKTGYKDGSFTGSVVDAFYGLVQVKVTIVNGRITDVIFLSYPNEAENSRNISNRAIPLLQHETITAQSAKVDIISGATETSLAFKESLAVALASAKY